MVAVGGFEEVKSRAEVVSMGNEDLEDEVQVFGKGFDVELEDGGEGFQGFVGQIGVAVDADDVGEEGRGDGVVVGVESGEEVVHEREVVGAAQFEDEGVEGGVRVAEIGLAGG